MRKELSKRKNWQKYAKVGGTGTEGIVNAILQQYLMDDPNYKVVSQPPRGSRKVRQLVSSLREHHSKKPDEVRRRIEQMFPHQTKIELFSRQKVEGWDCWGNEV